nr:hypothetical protein [Tanacetum cinerariifolium]
MVSPVKPVCGLVVNIVISLALKLFGNRSFKIYEGDVWPDLALQPERFVVFKQRLMVFLDLKLRLFLCCDLKTSLKKEMTAEDEKSTAEEEMTRSTWRESESDWEMNELNRCETSHERLWVLMSEVKLKMVISIGSGNSSMV